MFSAALVCAQNNTHQLLVSRWKNSDRAKIAEQYLCQACFRLFDHEELAKMHCDKRDIEHAMEIERRDSEHFS